jgi:hypothetical protein
MAAIQAARSLGPQVEATGRPAPDALAPFGPALPARAPGDVQSTPTSADLMETLERADGACALAEEALTHTSQLLKTLRSERQLVQQGRDQARETAQRIREQRHDAIALMLTSDGGPAGCRRSAAPG